MGAPAFHPLEDVLRGAGAAANTFPLEHLPLERFTALLGLVDATLLILVHRDAAAATARDTISVTPVTPYSFPRIRM